MRAIVAIAIGVGLLAAAPASADHFAGTFGPRVQVVPGSNTCVQPWARLAPASGRLYGSGTQTTFIWSQTCTNIRRPVPAMGVDLYYEYSPPWRPGTWYLCGYAAAPQLQPGADGASLRVNDQAGVGHGDRCTDGHTVSRTNSGQGADLIRSVLEYWGFSADVPNSHFYGLWHWRSGSHAVP